MEPPVCWDIPDPGPALLVSRFVVVFSHRVLNSAEFHASLHISHAESDTCMDFSLPFLKLYINALYQFAALRCHAILKTDETALSQTKNFCSLT